MRIVRLAGTLWVLPLVVVISYLVMDTAVIMWQTNPNSHAAILAFTAAYVLLAGGSVFTQYRMKRPKIYKLLSEPSVPTPFSLKLRDMLERERAARSRTPKYMFRVAYTQNHEIIESASSEADAREKAQVLANDLGVSSGIVVQRYDERLKTWVECWEIGCGMVNSEKP